MKSVKLAAVSSLFAALSLGLAGLAGCAAEVTPGEPEVVGHAAARPGQGAGGGGADNQQVVGTSTVRHGALAPWAEPLPNPWHEGPDQGLPGSHGATPSVDPGAPFQGPTPIYHVTEDSDVERYNGPGGRNAK